MSNFADELKSVKLRKSKEIIKDYSSPKLAGFLTKESIEIYQSNVLNCNIEHWYEKLNDLTFKTKFCPIYLQDACLFVKIYEKLFKDKNNEELIKLNNWKDLLNKDELNQINNLETRLQKSIEIFNDKKNDYVFIKTSCRSAKDSPLIQQNFEQIYKEYLNKLDENLKSNENEQIICMLKAAFECLKVINSIQAIDMFIRSERIYQDMLLALEKRERFEQNFIIREFFNIDVDMEFRGFVFNHKLTALSQYNYLIYSKKLVDNKCLIKEKILEFFYTQVSNRLKDGFVNNYIIDFAILSDLKVVVIEINPFLISTDSALFSWEHERSILEDTNGFCFRITERPKHGSKLMLPYNIRRILDNN